jgi:hypothetical protein
MSEKPAPEAKPRAHCVICGQESREPLKFGTIRPAIAQAMLADHPELTADSIVCRKHVVPYRTRCVEEMLERERGDPLGSREAGGGKSRARGNHRPERRKRL